jgi:hypothetical protein
MFEQMAVSELSLGDKPMNDITQNQPVTEVGTYISGPGISECIGVFWPNV